MKRSLILIALAACAASPNVIPGDAADVPADAAPDAPPNRAPVASAGPDATRLIGSTVALDGSGSSDPDGAIVAYRWTVESAPAGSTAALSGPTMAWAAFHPDLIGSYTFALEVTDDRGATSRDIAVLTVEPGAFTVDAGPDQTAVFRSTAHLTGTVVSEAGPASVSWRVVAHPPTGSDGLVGPTTLTPSIYAEVGGHYVLATGEVYPGGLVSGPSVGREAPTAERPLYDLERGPAGKLRRYDGNAVDTPLVREWPYAAGAYPLGTDLWLEPDTLITSTGYVFWIDEDPAVDMTFRMQLAGDQPFEIRGVTGDGHYVMTLAVRVGAPSDPPVTQVRWYDRQTLALHSLTTLPDLDDVGVMRPTEGLAISATLNPPNCVYVIGKAGGTYARFVVPIPEP